jgi:LCP family protein required for cell wall assembly
MRDERQRAGTGEPYTGETIVMPRRRPAAPVRPPTPTRPARRAWRRVKLALFGLLGLVLLALALLYLQVRSAARQIVVDDVRSNPPVAVPLLGGVNVLIVGVDERRDNPQEGVRSDTLIVAHIDSPGRWVSLLSVPRDTLVDLDDAGPAKINAAYNQGYATAEDRYGAGTTARQGGMALAADTIERLLDESGRALRIHYIAQVNFEGFAGIIDALGGITIDVPKYILDEEYPTEDFQTMRVEFQPGVQRMDGTRALQYARTRHADSDFDRGARQQQVIQAIIAELRQRGSIGLMLATPRLLDGLGDTVATTMPFDRPDVLLALALLGSGMNPGEIGQVRLSPESDPNVQQNADFSLIWSSDGLRTAVDSLLTRPTEAAENASVQVFNAAGVVGLAGRVSGELEQAGFTVLPADNAPASDTAQTVVYNITGKPRTSRRLAETLRADLRQGAPEGIGSRADIVVVLGRNAAGP